MWHADFAGTLDAVVELDGRLIVLDHKTGRTLMPAKLRLRLAGYASGDFVGEAGVIDRAATEVLQRLDGAAVAHLRPELDDGLRVYYLAIDDQARAAWRAAVDLYAFYRMAGLVPSDKHKEVIVNDQALLAAAQALEAASAALRQAVGDGSPPAPRAVSASIQEGGRHRPDHSPVRRNKRGLYCPTKLDDDTWCAWTAVA